MSVSAHEALRALAAQPRELPFDLMLSDIVLPDMSGPELAAQVRAAIPEQPIAFMSGYSEQSSSRRAADYMLAKPFESAELVRRVRDSIADRRITGRPVRKHGA